MPQFLTTGRAFGPVVFAVDAHDLGVPVAAAGEDEGGEFAAFDAARVQALGVFRQLQAACRVVAVDDGRALRFGEEHLEFVPDLQAG